MAKQKLINLARAVLANESQAISDLVDRVGDEFAEACEIILACPGRIVVMGMGKSGHIGGKIAATLASTGTAAFFVHPGEASHGDMGMIIENDVVLAFSNSGETGELVTLLPLIKRLSVSLIAFTGNPSSSLAQAATKHIDVSVANEACPLGLAPTTSTTAALAMGDAMAISLLETRGFTADDFALSHPGGSLGRRLLLHVKDIMHTGDAVPRVSQDASLGTALAEMTRKGLGMTSIVDDQQKVLGIFTDGDLRRVLDHGKVDVQAIKITDVMTKNPKTGASDMLAAEILGMMQQFKINALPVVDENRQLTGTLNMHDVLRAGVV